MKRALAVAMLLVACSDHRTTERPADEKVALGGSVAARVGGTAIPVSLVAAVASAQKLSAADAARRVIDDEIAAQAARAKGLDQREPTSWNLTAARARIVSDRIYADAVKKGPPTDDEVKLLSDRHWAEVDRPPTFKVVHAIVMRPKDTKLLPKARALANALHDAVADASSQADFEARAKAVPHEKNTEIRVETIGTFRADGRTIEGGPLDETFAQAAAALPAVGATTGVIETDFGFHVIRLVEKFPPTQMAFEDRRVAFTEEAQAMRAREAVGTMMQALAARTNVELLPAAEMLMRSVKIEQDEQASLP